MSFRIAFACLLFVFSACHSGPETPTFKEVFLHDDRKAEGFFHPRLPEDALQALDSGWMYLASDSLPGIDREWPDRFLEPQPVSLPHRLPLPNHSLWYRWEGILKPGILLIDADDGVQCWLNGTRIRRAEEGDYFVVPASGKTELGLRVVNNAMSGGLRQVHFLSQADYLAWQEKRDQIREGFLADRKMELLQDPEHLKKCEELPFPELKERLAEYPILFTEPVLIWGTAGIPFIRWVSESAGTALLRTEGGEVLRVASSDGVFTQQVNPGETFSFDLHQNKSYQGNFSLTAPDPSEANIRMALWGDSQGGWKTFRKIADSIRAKQVDLSIGAGDLVNNGSEGWAYPRFLQLVSRMQTPQLLVPGNHDYDGYYDDLQARQLHHYLFLPETPTFAMQVFGPLAILSLDPNVNFPVSIPEGSRQREWLEKQMQSESWQNARWKMLLLHQPPYSQGWPGYAGEWTIRQLLEPFFHQGLVDLVVAGHTHDYERLSLEFSGNSVHFLVVGGAGGGLEPQGEQSQAPQMDRLIKKHHYGILQVDSTRMQFNAYDLDGNTLDEFTAKK